MHCDGQHGYVERHTAFGQQLLEIPGGWAGTEAPDTPVRMVSLRQLLGFRRIRLHEEAAPVFFSDQTGTVALQTRRDADLHERTRFYPDSVQDFPNDPEIG